MDAATNSTPELIKYALKALDIIFKEGISYMKCGTKLYNLIPKDTVQLNMFSIADPRAKQISAAVDKVNLAKGKGLVRFGIQGFEQSYKARTEHLSPFFTTRIDQIIKIKN